VTEERNYMARDTRKKNIKKRKRKKRKGGNATNILVLKREGKIPR
jgi:hypothetical protein